MTDEKVAEWFSYHAPTPEEVAVMQEWRAKATALGEDFCRNSPMNADRTYALRKLKEALMAMNSALVSPKTNVPY